MDMSWPRIIDNTFSKVSASYITSANKKRSSKVKSCSDFLV